MDDMGLGGPVSGPGEVSKLGQEECWGEVEGGAGGSFLEVGSAGWRVEGLDGGVVGCLIDVMDAEFGVRGVLEECIAGDGTTYRWTLGALVTLVAMGMLC